MVAHLATRWAVPAAGGGSRVVQIRPDALLCQASGELVNVRDREPLEATIPRR
jgi:hypothetical protein